MAEHELAVLVGGEAGQGLVTIGELLARSLVRAGYRIVVTQGYQSRIRGGHNTFAIRTSIGPIEAPREGVDVLVALDSGTVAQHRAELAPGGVIVADEASAPTDGVCARVPLAKLATGPFVNVAALGVTAALIGLDESVVLAAVERHFGAKKPEVAESNRRALEAAYAWAAANPVASPKLDPTQGTPERLMLNGNEAIALGAFSAGLRFCAFYPMSPSTSIPLALLKHADEMGVVVEQVEDEIAAINMAIGASFAGAPALVATSGGGFALMAEGVSLAAMTETPVVIVVGQRPGPATGLPTRTEQADLDFVLHAGHGEFPRAVFAPGTVEQGFHLTRKAFEMAERSQGPVFILTDQFLADSFRAVDPVPEESLREPAFPDSGPPGAPYRRYAITPSGVSPRRVPGATPHLVIADSDEHTEDGHLTEDLDVRIRMVEKRLRKAAVLAEASVPPEFVGDEDPDLLLVSWGSTRGAVLEAAAAIRAQGRPAAMLHFSQVWPLVPDRIEPRFKRAREVVVVEGNATGQFAGLIRRETSLGVSRRISRFDGLPFTPEYILRRLNHA
jgi:2-oxoglutarate/2-oxoacid ferredoxin oxidoreductase subunit alpha